MWVPMLILTACIAILVVLIWVPLQISLVLHLAAFFVASMVCHQALYRRRPAASDLTSFYLYMSLGGALGGVFAALVGRDQSCEGVREFGERRVARVQRDRTPVPSSGFLSFLIGERKQSGADERRFPASRAAAARACTRPWYM